MLLIDLFKDLVVKLRKVLYVLLEIASPYL